MRFMQKTHIIAAVLLQLLLLGACSTVPGEGSRAPSPFTITTQNSTYVGFFVSIEPAKAANIAGVELWYENQRVADGQILKEEDGAVQIVFHGSFTIYARQYARVKIITTDHRIHDFDIGDPVLNSWTPYHGTEYAGR